MANDKYTNAKDRAQGTKTPTDENPVNPVFAEILQPFSLEDFARGVSEGAKFGEKYLDIGPGQQFYGYYLGHSIGKIEEAGKLKTVGRLHWEYATKRTSGDGIYLFTPTGVTFSILEHAQLEQQIVLTAPPDGSSVFLVGKAPAKRATKRGRQMWDYWTLEYPGVRAPIRRIEASKEEREELAAEHR